MSYLRAHIFVPFHCFVQVFLPRKYSAVFLHCYILLTNCLFAPSVFSSLSVHNGLFVAICSQWSFQKKTKSSEKVWSAYKIWKDHSSKNWKRFKDSNTINRKEGFGPPRSATVEENTK